MARTAIIIGATGLVGRKLIENLLENDTYEKVTVIVRKLLSENNPKLVQIIEPNFSLMSKHSDKLDANDYFCAIGTTRKKSPSKRAYYKTDVAYPVALAKIAKKQPSFENFLVVSSYGSNPKSPIFYNMIKGNLELELAKLNLKSLKIFKPSLLLGERNEKRAGESLGLVLANFMSFFTIGNKKKLWTTSGDDLAKAMIIEARRSSEGVQKFNPVSIYKIARNW